MKINITQQLVLQSVNPIENRYRAYRISITPIQTNTLLYAVTCSWGRVTRLSRHKHFIFDSEKGLENFVVSVLNRRKQNHYTLVTKSAAFPESEVLIAFEDCPIEVQQATLF